MYHLVVVDHSLIDDTYWRRWRILTQKYDVRVTVLVPDSWKSSYFETKTEHSPEPVRDGRFQVRPLPTTTETNWSRYMFLSFDAELRALDPDHIHIQHHEMSWIHQQLILYAAVWGSDVRLTFFTMNALGVRQEKWHQRFRWWNLRRSVDAAFCHYEGCEQSLRDAGFKKPIYVQTSYGANEHRFYPDNEKRAEVREQLGFEDEFIIGYTGRLTEKKGIDTLFEALPLSDTDWALLLVGDGPMRDSIERRVERNGWEDRVQLTGYLLHEEVPRMMRAMDAFVLGSKTTPDWIDTFPRAIVEAMTSGVAVVGSDSGAIPYQVRDVGLIFPEGDADRLETHLRTLASDPERRQELARKGREQTLERFSQESLADAFYDAVEDLRTEGNGLPAL